MSYYFYKTGLKEQTSTSNLRLALIFSFHIYTFLWMFISKNNIIFVLSSFSKKEEYTLGR